MTESELQDYIRQYFPEENSRCEWKEYSNLKNELNGKAKDDIISYVSAIANMEGGHLVIGVKDTTMEIVGIRDFQNYTPQNTPFKLIENCTN